MKTEKKPSGRGRGTGGTGTVEAYRVITLTYRLDDDSELVQRLKELFRTYRAIVSLYYWLKRLDLDTSPALKRAKEQLPSYWRKVLSEDSHLYLFQDVDAMSRPKKQVLRLPLLDALHPHHGAYISAQNKLVIRLGNRTKLELPIPDRVLR